jgi:hypothetical protein
VTEPVNLPPEGSGRKRDSWSLKSLVEEVAGRPIGDFQDPGRPTHPYVEFHRARTASASAEAAYQRRLEESVPSGDPIDRVYPPLAGATGRALHGPENEHHAETLASVEGQEEPDSPGRRPHAPGPSRRPERVYLHYLLLHLDRLNDAALQYLQNAVDEELRHRVAPLPPAPAD